MQSLIMHIGCPGCCRVHSESCCMQQEAGHTRFAVADLAGQLQPLLERLFGAFQLDDSRENEYVMKCVCRVVVFVGPEVGADACIVACMTSCTEDG